MKAHTFFLSLLVVVSAVCCAQDWLPVAAEEAQTPPSNATHYRGDHMFLVYLPRPGTIDAALQCIQVGRYDSALSYSLAGPEGAELASGGCKAGEESRLTVASPASGLHRLKVSAGQNAYTVDVKNQYCVLEASPECPVHVISKAEKLFFFVPKGVACFSVFAKGGGPNETAKLSIFGPDGALVAEGATVKTGMVELAAPVAPGKDGCMWSLLLSRAETGTFEDTYFWLGGLIPPFVSTRATGMVLPFVHFETWSPSFADRALPISLNLSTEQLARCSLTAELADADSGNLVASADLQNLTDAPPQLKLDQPLADGQYSLRLCLKKDGKEYHASGDVYVLGNLVFYGSVPQMGRVSVLSGEPRRFVFYPNISLHPEAGLDACLIVANASTGGVQEKLPLPGLSQREIPVAPEDGMITFTLELLREGKTIFREAVGAIYVAKGAIYTELAPEPATGLPWPILTKGKKAVCFVPENIDAIPYNFLPKKEDTKRPIRGFGALGQYVSLTFGAYCEELLKGVTIRVSDLRSAEGTSIPNTQIEIRKALYWPQRVQYKTVKDFFFIPEMLERFSAVDLEPQTVHQFWLTVHVPGDAAPGEYSGAVEVFSGSTTVTRMPLQLEVLPFALKHPEDKVWGLYPDSGRWSSYPDSRVRAELEDIRAHGIDTLVMYPLRHWNITYEQGKLTVDLAEFKKYMRMYIEAGLRGPICMSFQGLDSLAYSLTNTKRPECTEEFQKVFIGILNAVRECGEKEKWPPAVYHFVDEPNRRNEKSCQEALRTLKLAKEAGYRTFTTVLDPSLANETLDPYLDVRCYSSGWSVTSEERNKQAVEDCLRTGDTYWWYGSGSYTGQEGNVICNRLLCGYAFVKSGASGEWSWTFQRPKGNPYDDFDSPDGKGSEDFCITYPARNAPELCTTLQWEGIREGITDAEYVFTLKDAISRAEKSPNDALRQKAAEARQRLNELMDGVPWSGGRLHLDFTAARCDQIRREVADRIVSMSENR